MNEDNPQKRRQPENENTLNMRATSKINNFTNKDKQKNEDKSKNQINSKVKTTSKI